MCRLCHCVWRRQQEKREADKWTKMEEEKLTEEAYWNKQREKGNKVSHS